MTTNQEMMAKSRILGRKLIGEVQRLGGEDVDTQLVLFTFMTMISSLIAISYVEPEEAFDEWAQAVRLMITETVKRKRELEEDKQ